MKYVIIVALLSFGVGFGARHWGIGVSDVANESDLDSSRSIENTNTVDASDTVSSKSGGTALSVESEKPWNERDYSDNWGELVGLMSGFASGSEDSRKLFKLIDTLSIEDRKALLEEAFAYEPRGPVRDYLYGMLWQLANKDSSVAKEFYEQLPQTDQEQYRRTFVAGWANKNPEGAWAWLQENPSKDQRGKWGDEITVVYQLARDKDKQLRAYELAQSIPDVFRRERITNVVIGQMVESGVDDALALTEGNEELTKVVMDRAVAKWSKEDPQMAAEFILENRDMATERNIGNVAMNLIYQEGMDSFQNFYEQVDDPKLQGPMAVRAAGRMATRDLDEAMMWVNSIEDLDMRRRAGFEVINELGFNDNLDTHLRIIEEGFGDTVKERRNLLNNTLREWKRHYPDKVREVVFGLEDDPDNVKADLIKNLNLK